MTGRFALPLTGFFASPGYSVVLRRRDDWLFHAIGLAAGRGLLSGTRIGV
jgi:hypothetical protein